MFKKEIGAWRAATGVLYAMACSVLLLYACGGGGGSSGSGAQSGGGSGSPGGGFIGIPGPVSNLTPITGFADVGGGNVAVSSASTPNAGDVIVIAGTTNYNGIYTVLSSGAASFTISVPFLGSETGTWQLGGGLIAGCSTTGNVPSIDPSIVASRFSGVAPLAVFFDASGTITNPATPRPFHDLGYSWTFGDSGPSAGNWTNGSRPGTNSRNAATGPVTAHVYESPGTYTVTLTITDGTNTVSNACIRIAVQDPDVVFAGANTTCFSTSGDFSDPLSRCDLPAIQVTTSDFATAIAAATPGRRLLFRQGETWNVGVSARLVANGPGLIASFGSSGIPPRVQSVFPGPPAPGNATMFVISDGATPNLSDWRITDLDLDGGGNTRVNGIVAAGHSDMMTFLRVRVHDARYGFQFAEPILQSLGHAIYDHIVIANSVVENINHGAGSGGNGMFLQANRLAVQGSRVENTTLAEHVVRIQYANTSVIQANTLRLPAPTKHALTLRAVTVGTPTVTATGVSEKVVITDNLLEGGAGVDLPVQVQPSASSEDQRIRNIILDGNLVLAGAGAQVGIIASADELTIRNNIIVMNGVVARNCTSIGRSGSEPAHSEIRILNNTCVTNDSAAAAIRVAVLDATNTNVNVANNLAYGPNLTGGTSVILLNGGSAGVSVAGNYSNAQIITGSPNFANFGGSSASDYDVGPGSDTINAGIVVPVFRDFFRNVRPQGAGYDIGAVER